VSLEQFASDVLCIGCFFLDCTIVIARLTKTHFRDANASKIMISHRLFFPLLGVSLLPRLCQGQGVYRYVVLFQGATDNEISCPAPNPTVIISSGTSDVQLVDVEGPNCVPDGNDLVCTGAGSVLFDVVEGDGLFDQFSGAILNVRLESSSEEPFSCSTGSPSQAFALGQLCPNDTVDYGALATCFPVSGFLVQDNSIPLCASFCNSDDGICTDQSLEPIYTERFHGGCMWPATAGGGDADDNEPTAAPTVAPPSSATNAPAHAPTPLATPSPDLSRTLPYTVYLSGGCIGQNELGVTEQATVRDCAALCDADQLCVSFEYENSGETCQLSSTCSSFDMTVNDPMDSFNWYLKEDM